VFICLLEINLPLVTLLKCFYVPLKFAHECRIISFMFLCKLIYVVLVQ
jgi:hypothetical protein